MERKLKMNRDLDERSPEVRKDDLRRLKKRKRDLEREIRGYIVKDGYRFYLEKDLERTEDELRLQGAS